MTEDVLVFPEDCVPAPGTTRPIGDGDAAILLSHLDGAVHAIGGICPHAGAPLAEGVVHQGRVICPWHKAEFCLKTGKRLAPPAVDDVAGYSIERAGGTLRLKRKTRRPAAPVDTDQRQFVIIGAGAAGAMAAQTFREVGFGGRVILIDRFGRVPYDRTLLSKYFLSGEKGGEKTPLQSQQFYARQDIERVAAEIVAIDPAARRLSAADGQSFDFDALLIAPGAMPLCGNLPEADLPNVFTLRSREDADAILAQAERSGRAVVLGSSFIGMEVAASLRERGLAVTIVGRERVPFETQLGAEIGIAFTSLHEENGVTFRLGAEVAGVARDGNGVCVTLGTGETLAADFAVLGFGVRPATGFAAALPRGEDGSLIVDAELRVSDGIFAAGDAAGFPLHGTGARVRVEHWRVAQQQGRIAALNMLGKAMTYESAPVFWTIQYRQRLDYIGHTRDWDSLVIHGDVGRRDFLAYYVKNGRVAAAAGFGRDRETAALVALMNECRTWRPADLGETPSTLLDGSHASVERPRP